MATCGFCGGLGRVAAGGITSQFAGVFGMDIRPCGRCGGSGQAELAEPRLLPRQRMADPNLSSVLPGEWLVEIHGMGRILAVIRFLLTIDDQIRNFEASCEYGGLPEWRAYGAWTTRQPGNVVRFSGTQTSPFVLAAGYRWDVMLDALSHSLLRGQSIADELTMWNRKLDLTTESEPGDDRARAAADAALDLGMLRADSAVR